MEELDDIFYLGISDEAKKIFDTIAKEYPEKINKKLDFALLANYSESCVRLKDLFELTRKKNLVIKSKNGETYIHPLQKLICEERTQIAICASKLGLEPASRVKIKGESSGMGRPPRGLKRKMLSSTYTE